MTWLQRLGLVGVLCVAGPLVMVAIACFVIAAQAEGRAQDLRRVEVMLDDEDDWSRP